MKKELFNEMLGNAKLAAAHSRGEKVKARKYHIAPPEHVDVKAIRQRIEMTQEAFAKTFGFSVSGVKKWESGERTPEGPARVLLHMISKDANAVLRLAQ
jgi:putative transcriptional regulator